MIWYFLPLIFMFHGGWILSAFILLLLIRRLVFGNNRLRRLEAENRRLREAVKGLQ